MLGKKTKNDLSKYLHIGTVRDFKLNTNKLKDALQSALSQTHEIEETESPNLDEIEHMSESEEDEPPVDEEIVATSTQSSGSGPSGIVKDKVNATAISNALLNMNKINQKTAKKRKSNEVKEPVAKKKKRTPMKINKPAMEESDRRRSTSSEFSGPFALSETSASTVVAAGRRRSSRKSK